MLDFDKRLKPGFDNYTHFDIYVTYELPPEL